MRSKVSDASAAAIFGKNLKKTRRTIPRRGQIKMRIAAKAFQSLASVVSYSAQHLNSPRKKSQYN